jgi:hypothetical protein
MKINGTEIDFSKQRGYFFNMDCMKALKQMPDKSVSLAIVDPPYGAGFTEGGGCQGWFSKYHQGESSQICQVERERDGEAVEQVRRTVQQVQEFGELRTRQDGGETSTGTKDRRYMGK